MQTTLKPTTKKSKTLPSSVVVTRNYLKKTPAKYIIRILEVGKEPQETEIVVVKNAKVSNTYDTSRLQIEMSFGCGTVIEGTLVSKTKKLPSNARKMRFNGNYFVDLETKNMVSHFAQVHFTSDGIFYV